MNCRRRTLAAAGTLAGLGLSLSLAGPAPGQNAAPVPCVGMSAEDPAGDARYGFAGNFSPAPADDTVDMTGIFFRSEGGVVTANMRVADLQETPPPQANGVVYRMLYTSPADLFLDVDIDKLGNVSAAYGHFDTRPIADGETEATLYPGPDGIISVVLPPGWGGKTGEKLQANVFSSYDMGAVLASADYIPDSGTFRYNGATCGGGETTQPAPVSTGPAPQQQPSGGSPPPQQQPVRQLTVRATPKTLRARKTRKGRKVAFKLTSSEELRDVRVALRKGKRAFGFGKRASLNKTGRVKLKLKRTAKKGRYTLAINGKRADGSNGAAFAKIRIK